MTNSKFLSDYDKKTIQKLKDSKLLIIDLDGTLIDFEKIDNIIISTLFSWYSKSGTFLCTNAITLQPKSEYCFTTLSPINPPAPVTKTVFIFSLHDKKALQTLKVFSAKYF